VPCFMPLCFIAPCQFTPFLNLCSFIFSLLPFGWFICVYLSLLFYGDNIFDSCLPDSHPPFTAMQLQCKTQTWCILFIQQEKYESQTIHSEYKLLNLHITVSVTYYK
jgi:hypothetical protein